MAKPRTSERSQLTELVLKVFELNGAFLRAADEITAETPLTAARWQVLGAVLRGPLSVSEIARAMGLTRQSVQRLADALVEDGLCAYAANPAHRRAKLVQPTRLGWRAIETIAPIQIQWAERVTQRVGESNLRKANAVLDSLREALLSQDCQVHPNPRAY